LTWADDVGISESTVERTVKHFEQTGNVKNRAKLDKLQQVLIKRFAAFCRRSA